MKNLGFIVVASLVISGCAVQVETPTRAASQTCPNNSAEIAVGDGFFKALCGCAEAAGTTVSSAGTLTCTVPTGSFVFFQFVGTRLRHQIVSTGTPSFAASPVTDPVSKTDFPVHAVQLQTPGTYVFQDTALPSGLNGRIIAQ